MAHKDDITKWRDVQEEGIIKRGGGGRIQLDIIKAGAEGKYRRQ